jgi:hypothetical protein
LGVAVGYLKMHPTPPVPTKQTKSSVGAIPYYRPV